MNTIDQLLDLVPQRHRARAMKLLREWHSPSEDVAEYFDKYVPVLDRVNIALMASHGVGLAELEKNSRERSMVDLRKIVAHYLRTVHNYTLYQISKVFDRDHATAIHYVRQHEEHIKFDVRYKEKNDKFLKAINHDESNHFEGSTDTLTATLDILRHRAYAS